MHSSILALQGQHLGWRTVIWRLASGARRVLIASCLIAAVGWSQSCAPDFLITPTPNGPQYNRLKGVAGFDVNDVWAVGFTNGNNDQTLTEHWDGSTWAIIPSPNQQDLSTLSAVAGIATNDLWAVGSSNATPCCQRDQPLTEHWDGAEWSVVSSPNLNGFDFLNAVAAVASHDVWAVGQDGRPTENAFFLHWDGQSWSIVDAPSNAGPQFAVAALASNDVWSAGSGRGANNTSLFNHWDGTSWTTVPNPPITPGGVTIRALSAFAPDDIWAAGSRFVEFCDADTCYDSEYVEVLHWDGQSWSAVSGPIPNALGWARLKSIAAQPSGGVWAVGSDGAQTLASHWDGAGWTNAGNIQLGSASFLESVTAVGGDAWAVGWSAFPGRDQTLAARYRCN